MTDDIPETKEGWFREAKLKIPKDSPTKEGERVTHRGWPDMPGTVLRFVRQPTWMEVNWDNKAVHPPKICHASELKLETAP